MSRGLTSLAALAALTTVAGTAGVARAQPARPDVFALGRSAASGAVCQAVRDYDDPAAQAKGARAWRVSCRGWGVPLGRLYLLPGPPSEGAWRTALAARAACESAKARALPGLPSAQLSACRTKPGSTPYLAYVANGRRMVAADGYARIGDVLETGLRIVAGAAAPPPLDAAQTSAASVEVASTFPSGLGGLAEAERVAVNDPGRLRAHGYVQNNEWRFSGAETDFRALAIQAESGNRPATERAEAMLNLGLNVSNAGRFKEADAAFAEADSQIAVADDPVLRARAQNYRALHLRNQRRFDDAIAEARASLEARKTVRAQIALSNPNVMPAPGAPLAISPALARALNVRASDRAPLGRPPVSPEDELRIQDAQALEIIGSSLAAKGDVAGARTALTRARDLLAERETYGQTTSWLHAQAESDLAGLDLRAGRTAQAIAGYTRALAILRTRHAGTATEANLLLKLGGAQAAAGQTAPALATFGRAFEVFRDQRGAVGDSIDLAQPYFDLLLAERARDPGHAADYDARFFAAAETAISDATAATVERLAERIASGDDQTTGLARGLDDTRRQVRVAEGQVALLQQENRYSGAAKTEVDAQLKALSAQAETLQAELLAANPRYGQLVSSGASLTEVQKALRPDEIYVKLLLLGDKSYGVLVSRDGATPYAIALTRDQASNAATKVRSSFEAEDSLPPFDVALSHTLFEQLFGPVKARLLAAKHLIYEADGALISLPAAVFVTDDASAADVQRRKRPGALPDYRGVKWLGAAVDSSLVVSGASFLQSRSFRPSRAAAAYIGFGDPALPRGGDRAYASLLPPPGLKATAAARICGETRDALLQIEALPETAGEVRAIGASLGARPGDMVLGQAFTDSDVKARSDLKNYRVVYFATHGILPQPDACLPEPALVTSLGAGDSDALLDASEILGLQLDADLVVLAACDTGGQGSSGPDRTGLDGGGEALGGLTRAMIYAGARGLIVSHWSVGSDSAVKLMTGLFQSGAPTQAEGLQRAQLALQRDAAQSHPYFWAPFTIVGDGARPLPSH